MPLYDFACRGCNAVTESRQGIDTTSIPCLCGSEAQRVGVYREQFARTGDRPATPNDQKDLSRDFSEYTEASAEVDYHYKKAEESTGQAVAKPDLFKVAKTRARAAGAAIA